jgi:hypothetical protein
MRLELSRCVVREWSGADRESLVRHANNPRVAANLRDVFPSPYAASDAEGYLAFVTGRAPQTSFASAVDGEAARRHQPEAAR